MPGTCAQLALFLTAYHFASLKRLVARYCCLPFLLCFLCLYLFATLVDIYSPTNTHCARSWGFVPSANSTVGASLLVHANLPSNLSSSMERDKF